MMRGGLTAQHFIPLLWLGLREWDLEATSAWTRGKVRLAGEVVAASSLRSDLCNRFYLLREFVKGQVYGARRRIPSAEPAR